MPMPFAAILLCLVAAPVAVLLVLALAGLAAFWPAMAGIVLTLLPCAAFALVWSRDLTLLTDAVRRLAAVPPSAADSSHPVIPHHVIPHHVIPHPVIPHPVIMEPLGLELARLARILAARTAQTELERRADTLILESLPDPLIVLREDRSVGRHNPAAEAILGADLPAILRHPALREAQDRAAATGGTATARLTIAAPVGRDLLATVVPVMPPLQDGGHTVVVLSDRTRETSAERSHTDFVANVSHELRTPLASLIGFTETLLGPAENDPTARKRFLTIMAEQGARMNRLIDDLLSLSRIELVEHQPPSERVDLTSLLPRIVVGYEPRLAAGGGRIALDIAKDVPGIVADQGQITQIAQNLLDNGVKYGREGGTVRLTVRVPGPDTRPIDEPWPARPGVVLSVADDGTGIPRAHLPRLTERFYRVDKGRSRAVGGTGLGLAIVKHIVNRHRGLLRIDSEEGVGTTVSVWLPLTQGAPREGMDGRGD